MIELGEAIQFGSDSMVMEEAADLLDRLTDGEADRETIARIMDDLFPQNVRAGFTGHKLALHTQLCELIGLTCKHFGKHKPADAILAARPTLSESGDYVLVPREKLKAARGYFRECGNHNGIAVLDEIENALAASPQPSKNCPEETQTPPGADRETSLPTSGA